MDLVDELGRDPAQRHPDLVLCYVIVVLCNHKNSEDVVRGLTPAHGESNNQRYR